MRAVVRLGMLLRRTLDIVPANITDEAIDEALTAKSKVIKRNIKRAQGKSINSLSFRTCKDLRQTITIRSQNFSSSIWDRFYITYLHTPSMYCHLKEGDNKVKRAAQVIIILCEKGIKIINGLFLIRFHQTNEWKLDWIYKTQKCSCSSIY